MFGEPRPDPSPRSNKKLCADHEGYSLHAAIRIGAGKTTRLERLCRYLSRPALAQDRLSVSSDGSIVYRFRRAWRNGKLAIVMDPMTFMSRLAAQVPPPRFHLLSYYGVLAPAASRREEIVPPPAAEDEDEPVSTSRSAKGKDGGGVGRSRPKRQHPERVSWSELLKRVFLFDILHCP
ncbi:MAG: hypothetical protein GY944_07225, partial [bacterium]|nr:hypothetical protein [bacterium]